MPSPEMEKDAALGSIPVRSAVAYWVAEPEAGAPGMDVPVEAERAWPRDSLIKRLLVG